MSNGKTDWVMLKEAELNAIRDFLSLAKFSCCPEAEYCTWKDIDLTAEHQVVTLRTAESATKVLELGRRDLSG